MKRPGRANAPGTDVPAGLMDEPERALEAIGGYPWRNKADDSCIRKLKQLFNDLYSTVYAARRIL